PLVGDLLLEVTGPELLGVEEFEARFAAAEHVAFGQRDPRFGDVGAGDADRGAAVLELVGDALRFQRFGDLAGFGRFDPGRERRVALLGRHLEEDEGEDHERQRGAAQSEFAAGREPAENGANLGHGQIWVWKISVYASTALLRTCEASCIDSCASWTE